MVGPTSAGAELQLTVSPVDQTVVVRRELLKDEQLDQILATSQKAFQTWSSTSLGERITIAKRFLTEFEAARDELSRDLSMQMGRPISHCGVEVDGTIARGKHMISLAKGALADSKNEDTDTPRRQRYIKRCPIGPVLVISPWNYPYFCQVNAVLPAILAGNSVLLKPSPQTPLCGEWFAELYRRAGLPSDILQVLHLTPSQVDEIIRDKRVKFVQFTGSVANGHAVVKSASESFKGVGLELGGKDPAYVRADANLDKVSPALADGIFFNAGQSCCSVERVYAHAEVYDAVVKGLVTEAKRYRPGNPSDPTCTLGPVVSTRSADAIREQVRQAVASGAKTMCETSDFSKLGKNFIEPQVLIDVDHTMSIMMEETFGPVVGVMKVHSDEEAIRLMNNSPYGLTASIWTDVDSSKEAFERIAEALHAGTVYLNNADNLDPALAWSGWKDSGRGISLSKFGFDAFTRTKSISITTLWLACIECLGYGRTRPMRQKAAILPPRRSRTNPERDLGWDSISTPSPYDMSSPVLGAIESRRSNYVIGPDCPVPRDYLERIVSHCIRHTPSMFNMQSTRVVILYGKQHHRLWDMIQDSLDEPTLSMRPNVAHEHFPTVREKIATLRRGHGTILFFEDTSVVQETRDRYTKYGPNFDTWSLQSSAMAQYAVWIALAAEAPDLGMTLQHYYPARAAVDAAWNIPADWKMTGQMPFGTKAAKPVPKTFRPDTELVRSFG